MGDRALITFKSGNDYSPAVYLHWNGSDVEGWLKEAAPLLRKGDSSYAAARFCGFCHSKTDGPCGLGLLPAPTEQEAADLKTYSHGDAGVFVVDVDSGFVTVGGGYGKSFNISPDEFAE